MTEGGPVRPGTVIVGDCGPEYFVPDRDGYVVPVAGLIRPRGAASIRRSMAYRPRRTFLGFDSRAWTIALPAGLLFPVLGWLAIALLALAAGS